MIRSSSNERYTNWFDSFRMTERVYCAGLCPGKPLIATAATTSTAITAKARPRQGEGMGKGSRTPAKASSPVLGLR